MTTIAFTDFRKNASELLSRVEKGEVLLVMRHGKPVAEISPVSPPINSLPSWKKPGFRLVAKGVRLSSAIMEDRAHESVL